MHHERFKGVSRTLNDGLFSLQQIQHIYTVVCVMQHIRHLPYEQVRGFYQKMLPSLLQSTLGLRTVCAVRCPINRTLGCVAVKGGLRTGAETA